MKFYKIVNPEGHQGMTYTEGLNTDVMPFNDIPHMKHIFK